MKRSTAVFTCSFLKKRLKRLKQNATKAVYHRRAFCLKQLKTTCPKNKKTRSRVGARYGTRPPSWTPRRPARFSFFAPCFPGCVFFTSFPVTNGLLTNENSQQQAPRKRTICTALVRTFSALLIQNSPNVWFSGRFGSVWPDSAVCMCGNSESCHRQLAQRLLGHRWFYVF